MFIFTMGGGVLLNADHVDSISVESSTPEPEINYPGSTRVIANVGESHFYLAGVKRFIKGDVVLANVALQISSAMRHGNDFVHIKLDPDWFADE